MDPENKVEATPEVQAPEAPVVETVEPVATEDKDKGLSLREALEVGLEATKAESKEEKQDGAKTDAEVVSRDAGTVANRGQTGGAKDIPVGRDGADRAGKDAAGNANSSHEPPAEWSKEEKEDFLASSPKAQAAALRLHKARQGKLEEIKRESAELQWAKDIAKEAISIAKQQGEEVPTQAHVLKSLRIVNEIQGAKSKQAVISILKAKNFEVPPEIEKLAEADGKDSGGVNNAVLERLNKLESTLAHQNQATISQTLNQLWSGFERETNAAGAPKYPDVQGDSGLRLASSIGSLVNGTTDLSKQFIAMVQERIPGATYLNLLEEAYKWSGGRVDDSQPTKTQSTQQHIVRAQRASSVVPGSAKRNGTSNARRSLPLREAIQAAIERQEELQE